MRISYGIRGKRLSANVARRSMWPDAPSSDSALAPMSKVPIDEINPSDQVRVWAIWVGSSEFGNIRVWGK